MRITKAFTLAGQDGNAFNLLAYTTRAMRNANRSKEYADDVVSRAKSSDYNNLICVLHDELMKINEEFNMEYDEEDYD